MRTVIKNSGDSETVFYTCFLTKYQLISKQPPDDDCSYDFSVLTLTSIIDIEPLSRIAFLKVVFAYGQLTLNTFV